MRSKPLLLLLALAACGGGAGDGATTTTAGDSVTAPVGSGKFKHAEPPKPMLDTGAVAPPQSLVRETYGYSFTSASRDPFRALNTMVVEGPEFPDLELTSLIFNRTDPKQSIAVFLDKGSKKRYSVRPGDRIGRMTLVSVDANGAVLRINDFGTTREQPYTLRKQDGN